MLLWHLCADTTLKHEFVTFSKFKNSTKKSTSKSCICLVCATRSGMVCGKVIWLCLQLWDFQPSGAAVGQKPGGETRRTLLFKSALQQVIVTRGAHFTIPRLYLKNIGIMITVDGCLSPAHLFHWKICFSQGRASILCKMKLQKWEKSCVKVQIE